MNKESIIRIKNLLEQIKHSEVYPNLSNISFEDINELYNKSYISENDFMILYKILQDINIDDNKSYNNLYNKYNEEVLVVERGIYNKFYNTISNDLNKLQNFININGKLIDRNEAEYNPKYIQLIVYMISYYRDRILILENIKYKNDKKKGKYDFPAGHMNSYSISENIVRELNEELNFPKNLNLFYNYKGLIYPSNNMSSISYYHSGIIISINIPSYVNLNNNETDKHNIKYFDEITDEELLNDCDNWFIESLSKFIL